MQKLIIILFIVTLMTGIILYAGWLNCYDVGCRGQNGCVVEVVFACQQIRCAGGSYIWCYDPI